MPSPVQAELSFGPVHNFGLFSSHWLEHRLELEPEWRELRDEADDVLQRLAELWKVQRNRVERYGDEQGLEEGLIQPVLRALGWQLKYQTFVQGREPDYALFLDDAALDAALEAGRNSPDFWTPAKVVADAKAWHVSLDRPVRVQNQREYPPQQIEWYLERTHLDWGMLTNGKLWRLVPRVLGPHQRRFQTYLEVDLPAILNAWLSAAGNFSEQSDHLDDFLRFYLFFGPAGYRETVERKSLLRRANEGSSEYRLSVGEDLKGQTFEALRVCIEGFLSHAPNNLNSGEYLLLCREQSFILLYRLLFIMYAEDRRLLPYKVNRLYTDNRSLGRLRDDVARRLDRSGSLMEDDFKRDSTSLWDDLETLFDLIDRGHARYGVPAYNGGLFDSEAHPFLTEKKLSDWHLARVIDHLGRAKDPKNPNVGLSRVDYRDLAIQHLGGIYEGLLELHPQMAAQRMLVWARRVKGVREEIVKPESEGTQKGYDQTDIAYAPGSVYLITDKGERRAFGSYYTPDHIVDAIVRQTLWPMCDAITKQLQEETAACRKQLAKATGAERDALAEKLAGLERAYPERVLRLRVLDPAMGSSHFLLRACQFLAEEIATNPFTEEDHGTGESALAYWKRRVIESCLYGVDVNPLAVELAKLALWLETVAADRPLTFLDHHLRHGNSLIGAKVAQLRAHPREEHGMFEDVFGRELARKLPAFLEPLADICRSSSENLEQVKAKQKAYTDFTKAVTPFRQVADLWCAAVGGAALTPKLYHEALDVVEKPNRFKKVAEEEWFSVALHKARQEMACFHWELDFPEVFFDENGPLDRPGFDAVIGNPPYEVLSELESGQDLSNLRAFIGAEPIYVPSQRGKNNLYKLFICRALDLLANRGRLGFITPMAVLGDDPAADLRREMVRQGAFTAIEAFPQKDDPTRRVFPEAKLSTAVFVLEKGGEASAARPFRSRVHPGRFIQEKSPGVTLSTESIPLYDPSNFTIVSCDQADWDLAVRIMQSGRMGRLGEFCVSFQGEVNETNEKPKCLSKRESDGPLVLRGANICLYTVREASQGEPYYIKVARFLKGKRPDAKAHHSKEQRIGFQRSAPQNNFRRIIAAPIPANNFCFDTISYVPNSRSSLPPEFLLGLLNSILADWYFRLGGTSSKVSEYRFNILPCPLFSASLSSKEEQLRKRAETAVSGGRLEEALELLRPLLAEPPFSPAIRQVVIAAVQQIITFESDRGEIVRTERSALAPVAQPYQDLIDQLFFGMAGLTDDEVKALEERYEKML